MRNLRTFKLGLLLAFALFAFGAKGVLAAPSLVTPTISTQRVNAGGIAPNEPVYDVATVTGPQNLPNPTGSVQFYICHTNTAAFPTCASPSDGAPLGTPAAINGANCSNNACTATSPLFATPAKGTYCFLAVYTGNATFNPVTASVVTTAQRTAGCFFIDSPTAVSVSSMSAQAMEVDATWAMLGLGIMAMVTLGAVAFVVARKR